MSARPIALGLFLLHLGAGAAAAQTLVGFASLPAETSSPGPTSGQFINGGNGITPPFKDRQPVQGFSAVLRATGNDLWVLPDNGFGAKANSADWVLRMYRVTADFKTKSDGSGTVRVQSHITLRDPDRRLNFKIVADGSTYPPASAVAVDPTIITERLLTGADLDIESVRQAPDGSFWFGDEFGPFLLHTDATGKVLEAPIPLSDVRSPQNPSGGAPNLAASRGFEGTAISPKGEFLYPMLEGAVTGDDPRHLRISQFHLASKRFTDRRWFYRLESGAHSIGEFTAVSESLFLVLERDEGQGETARFKKIFLISLDVAGADGFLIKHQVADLLALSDPDRLGGTDAIFRFPFQTIESILVLNSTDLLVLNDNNYPWGNGRRPGRVDDNEFIVIRLDRPLDQIIK